MIARQLALAAALATGAAGCFSNPNFGAARTIPAGTAQHVVGLESWVYTRNSRGYEDVPTPPLVSYQLRYGLLDSLEIGARATVAKAGVDLKYNPLRTRYLDLAVDFGVWGVVNVTRDSDAEPLFIMGFDLPLMADLILSDRVAIVPWGGPTYLFVPESGDGAWGLRTGLGVRIGIADWVALQPDVNMLIDPQRGSPTEWSFGVGASFGAQPFE